MWRWGVVDWCRYSVREDSNVNIAEELWDLPKEPASMRACVRRACVVRALCVRRVCMRACVRADMNLKATGQL